MFERLSIIFHSNGADFRFDSKCVAEYRRRGPEVKSTRLSARVSIDLGRQIEGVVELVSINPLGAVCRFTRVNRRKALHGNLSALLDRHWYLPALTCLDSGLGVETSSLIDCFCIHPTKEGSMHRRIDGGSPDPAFAGPMMIRQLLARDSPRCRAVGGDYRSGPGCDPADAQRSRLSIGAGPGC
jgi:hypothetical protein